MSPDASTAEAVQQAIAHGAITEAYQADPQQVIQELNRLRATDVTSYLQYKQHAYRAVSLFAPGLNDDSAAHATLALPPADVLAQRIHQLGGVPLSSPVEIAAQAASVGVRPEQGPTLLDVDHVPLRDVMQPDPECLQFDDELVYALHQMLRGAYRHVPVVDEQRRPTALVSLQVIIDELVAAFPHELLNLPPSSAHAIAPTPEGA